MSPGKIPSKKVNPSPPRETAEPGSAKKDKLFLFATLFGLVIFQDIPDYAILKLDIFNNKAFGGSRPQLSQP